jgi:predicted translin family RNA/ssDNA-binding protein
MILTAYKNKTPNNTFYLKIFNKLSSDNKKKLIKIILNDYNNSYRIITSLFKNSVDEISRQFKIMIEKINIFNYETGDIINLLNDLKDNFSEYYREIIFSVILHNQNISFIKKIFAIDIKDVDISESLIDFINKIKFDYDLLSF